MDKELRKKYELSPEKLRYTADPKEFKPTNKIEPGLEAIIIGQDRAVESIRTGLKLEDKYSNIFITGSQGLGKDETIRTVLKQYIENMSPEEHAKKIKQRRDLLAAYNFKAPENPLILELPQGFGEKFEKDLNQAVNYILHDGIKNYEKQFEMGFMTDNSKMNELSKKLKAQQEKLKKEDQKIQAEINKLEKLSQETQDAKEAEKYNDKIEKLTQEYAEMDQDSLEKEMKIQAEMEVLQSQNTSGQKDASKNYKDTVIKPELDRLKNKYPTQRIKEYLEQFEEAITRDVNTEIGVAQMHVGAKMGGGLGSMMQMPPPPDKSPYQVKILNKIKPEEQIKGIPVIYEKKPTLESMFGTVEAAKHMLSPMGTEKPKKDQHLRLEAGSFTKAIGGYYVVNMMKMAQKDIAAFERLIEDLDSGKTNIENFRLRYYVPTISEDVKSNVKVIINGNNEVYQQLRHYSKHEFFEEFNNTFRIKSEFDNTTDNTKENREQYSKYIARFCKKKGLKNVTPEGIAEIIEYSTRLTSNQGELTLKISEIAQVLREANLKAGNNKEITGEHVAEAVKSIKDRHGLIEEKYQKYIDENIYVIETSGEKIGELNGLAVLTLEDVCFGKPSRITASKPVEGKGWIRDVHEQIDRSGPSKKMGDHILNMIAKDRYASPLSKSYAGKGIEFECLLAHEQTYSMIDGDSASSTGLYTALSSIGQFPLDIGIAVTGRVSQKEEVQAIGGVNEKIEGFYMSCKAKGLTGSQGVMIPKINEKDLMLSEEVINSVKKGEFHIYSVSTIKEGLEILSGLSMDEIDKKIVENLNKFIPNDK